VDGTDSGNLTHVPWMPAHVRCLAARIFTQNVGHFAINIDGVRVQAYSLYLLSRQ